MKTAIYARYSTDKQGEASIEDQYRKCDMKHLLFALAFVALSLRVSYHSCGIVRGD